ncbi:unnamed protein product [Schistosoma margrebowiei]|uniref:Uncharacterized protein n=1 Tax=Schistosoma margrebowiei TaxID=48269 RepID=A0A183M6D1_9TREM|nr:unnamed protein product [Schistosoma margrebowiei]
MVSHTRKNSNTSLSEILNDHIVSKGNENFTIKLSRIYNLTSLKSNENNNIRMGIGYSTNPIVSKSLADTNPSIEIINRFSYQSNISKSSIDHVFERSSKPNSLYFIRPTQHAIDM